MRPGSGLWVSAGMALALVLAGCASEAPTAVVSADYFGNIQVTASVYDHAGIVASVEPLPRGAPPKADGVTVSDDGLTMDVRWTGGTAHREPPVTVTRAGGQYVVDVNIDGGGDIFSFFGSSTGLGLLCGLRLHLTAPVTADEIRLYIHGIFG
jgi:hypothetical protein